MPAIKVGHIAIAEWCGDAATLSPGAYAYLRKDLGFTGVAITDAMNMGAIVDHHKAGAATVTAFKADADMLLMPADTGAAASAVVDAVESGGPTTRSRGLRTCWWATCTRSRRGP